MSQLLPFQLGEEVYALELAAIQEVVENQTVHALPGGPAALAGAISFHGRIVPVVDLPLLLGFPTGNRAARIIVLGDEYGPIALTVDRLQAIINLDLAHNTLSQSDSEADCICGVINRAGELISLLDLDRLHQLLEQLCSDGGG